VIIGLTKKLFLAAELGNEIKPLMMNSILHNKGSISKVGLTIMLTKTGWIWRILSPLVTPMVSVLLTRG
jgi:hypothetical protein